MLTIINEVKFTIKLSCKYVVISIVFKLHILTLKIIKIAFNFKLE